MGEREYGYSSREETIANARRQSETRVHQAKPVRAKQKVNDSFGSQQVDLKNYVLSPEGWEGVMFTIYFLVVPYLIGVLFLFLFVAGSDIDNFLILDITAFFVLWAIGYEIVATLLMLGLLLSYLKWMYQQSKTKRKIRK